MQNNNEKQIRNAAPAPRGRGPAPRRKKSSPVLTAVAFGLAFVFALGCFAAIYKYNELSEEYAAASAQSADKLAVKEKELFDSEEALSLVNEKLTLANDNIIKLCEEIALAKEQSKASAATYDEELSLIKEELLGVIETLDGSFGGGSIDAEIEALYSSVNSKLDIITKLEKMIESYKNDGKIDVYTQVSILMQIVESLASGAPQKRTEVTTAAEETAATGAVTEKAEPVYEYSYPKLALCYEDLSGLYSFEYNENAVFNSASVVKLFYSWSLLRMISDAEDEAAAAAEAYKVQQLAALPEGADTSGLDFPEYIFSDKKYDLSEIWTYDPDTMKMTGSGQIKNKEKGFTLTYRELIEYALRYSDNIAFSQLRIRFGYTFFFNDSAAIGVRTVLSNFYKITALDCVKYLTEIKKFIDENERYGEFLYKCMTTTNYTCIIPDNVESVCGHKYGWDTDAYNDIAIVFNEKSPYILVILTNLDEGSYSIEILKYLGQVISLVDKLHTNLYENYSPAEPEPDDAAQTTEETAAENAETGAAAVTDDIIPVTTAVM